jgi:acetyl-CoA acetyltransferase
MAGDSYYAPHGIFGAPHSFALRMNRFIEQHGAGYEAQKAVARASYYHAQQNPHAVMHGRPLDEKTYDESRWIAEPFHLYDCCQENDAAAAVIIAPTEQARDLVEQPIPIIAAAQGNTGRSGGPIFEVYTADDWDTADFASPASRLFKQAGLTPQDMDFVQGYTNFTGGTVMAMVDHGFCAPSEVDKFLTFENLTAPNGMLPLNTAGGMAEVYVHGMELHVEAVRQLRGQSSNPVADAKYGLVFAGPMSPPVTTTIYARADAIG